MEAHDLQVIDALVAHESDMAERMRHFDWAATPVGPPSTWPVTLRVALGICLNSKFPMFVRWGPELIQFYNDAYTPILGQKHPHALGRPVREIWAEVWPTIEPQINAVMRDGQSSWNERVKLQFLRNGYLEDAWITWSYSPIPDGLGGVGGIFCACTEETANVRAEAERDILAEQRRLALNSARLGWWNHDLQTNEVVWDDRFKAIFGVEHDSLSFDAIMESVHPDDREEVTATVQAAIAAPDNPPYSNELRVVLPDGSIRWVASQGKVHNMGHGPTGPQLSLVGTVADITGRKRNAEALLERTRFAELNAAVGKALTGKSDELEGMLAQCARAMVEHLDAALACIWTLQSAGAILELQANAGAHTLPNSPYQRNGSQGVIPLGESKIGLIALERTPFLTNNVVEATMPRDRDAAKKND
ncbi:PAS domain S-box protein [bacterium]|nr:MAG: PAS domain S-box protein [bacterium]